MDHVISNVRKLQERNSSLNLCTAAAFPSKASRESQSIFLILFLNILWSQKWLVIQKLHQESKDRLRAMTPIKAALPEDGKKMPVGFKGTGNQRAILGLAS